MVSYNALRKWLLKRQQKLHKNPNFYEGVIVGAYLCGAFNKLKYDELRMLLRTKMAVWKERESLKELDE